MSLLFFFKINRVICETGDCREQEFRDHTGKCVLCKQCGPGMELSKVSKPCFPEFTLFLISVFDYMAKKTGTCACVGMLWWCWNLLPFSQYHVFCSSLYQRYMIMLLTKQAVPLGDLGTGCQFSIFFKT